MPRPVKSDDRPACAPLAALGKAICLWAFLTPAGPAAAHPHVFIDADAALIFGKSGALEAIRVTWTYDEFYSLMMIEDARLDQDGDGIPEPARLDAFAGQDVDWAAGFPGHILAEQAGKAVGFLPPVDHRAHFRAGRVITSHIRPLKDPIAVTDASPLNLRLYDPEYFVAYDTPRLPTVEGRRDCKVTRRAPDTSGQAALLAELQNIDMQSDSLAIMNMPDVGITFAEGFKVTCGGR